MCHFEDACERYRGSLEKRKSCEVLKPNNRRLNNSWQTTPPPPLLRAVKLRLNSSLLTTNGRWLAREAKRRSSIGGVAMLGPVGHVRKFEMNTPIHQRTCTRSDVSSVFSSHFRNTRFTRPANHSFAGKRKAYLGSRLFDAGTDTTLYSSLIFLPAIDIPEILWEASAA